jgi:hypothetical protein
MIPGDLFYAQSHGPYEVLTTQPYKQPGQLVFCCDMLLPLLFQVDWVRLQQCKQDLIIQNNTRENNTRKRHTNTVGNQVLHDKPFHLPNLSAPRTGPHTTITATYTNGTVRVQHSLVNELVNVRCLTPYCARAKSN